MVLANALGVVVVLWAGDAVFDPIVIMIDGCMSIPLLSCGWLARSMPGVLRRVFRCAEVLDT